MVRAHERTRPSILDLILEELATPRGKYKGVPHNIIGIPTLRTYKPQSIRNVLSRLDNVGYIRRVGGHEWAVTRGGREYLQRRQENIAIFAAPIDAAPSTTLLMFDVPEAKKAEREWLRFHLRRFGYRMIQRSVWVGPALSKEFGKYLNEIGLQECIKTFKLARPYRDT